MDDEKKKKILDTIQQGTEEEYVKLHFDRFYKVTKVNGHEIVQLSPQSRERFRKFLLEPDHSYFSTNVGKFKAPALSRPQATRYVSPRNYRSSSGSLYMGPKVNSCIQLFNNEVLGISEVYWQWLSLPKGSAKMDIGKGWGDPPLAPNAQGERPKKNKWKVLYKAHLPYIWRESGYEPTEEYKKWVETVEEYTEEEEHDEAAVHGNDIDAEGETDPEYDPDAEGDTDPDAEGDTDPEYEG